MKNQPTKSKSGALTRIIKATFTPGLLAALVLLFSIQASRAGSATWNLNPTSGDWNTAANWTPATVPNGPEDTATFGVSNATAVLAEFGVVEVNSIVFQPGASAFRITSGANAALTISGAGISNDSGLTQNFFTNDVYGSGSILFTNGATAGSLSAFRNQSGCYSPGGLTEFYDTSNAGGSTFTNDGGYCGYSDGAHTRFFNSSSADNGVFLNYSSDYFGDGATTEFYGAATAANATLINTAMGYGDGGITEFYETATAGNAALIANGGSEYGSAAILFFGDSTGDKARVEVFDYSYLGISSHNFPGVTIGSLEGDGFVYLGANNLTVGSNNLSTTFSGVIQDAGSLTKIGTGTLTLTGTNTYTRGTTIEGGKLVVNTISGSGTGSGGLQVNGGTLGGRGTIAGAVTVGTGSGTGAVLAPGRRGGKPGTPLTIQSTLTFNSDATYNCGLNTKAAVADQVVVNGLTINGALFSFVVGGHRVLSPGIVFTVISNTGATPITGTFSNLADGSTFTVHGNTFHVSYEGGDGNDLTLTVMP